MSIMMFFVLAGIFVIGYPVFYVWLFRLAMLAFRKVPVFWKMFLISIWIMIVGGHLSIFASIYYIGFDLLITAGLAINLGITAHVLPLSITEPIAKRPRVGQLLGLVPSIIIIVFFAVFLISGYLQMGRQFFAVANRVIFILGVILLSGILGIIAARLKLKAIFVVTGFVLFEISFLGFMTIGVFVLPAAMLFQAAGIYLASSDLQQGKEEPSAQPS